MLKRIKIKQRLRVDPTVAALTRMSQIVLRLSRIAKTKSAKKQAMGYALQYYTIHHDHMFLRIRQCIAKAEKEGSWQFMHGCFSQATEIYAVASMAYEVFDQPIMSDALFDSLAAFLLKNYESITDFCKQEWNLNKGIFRAGTGSSFRDVKAFPSLLPYYNRLQAEYQKEAEERERTRTKNKSRVLRKTPVGTGKRRAGTSGKPLRRIVRKG